jgi:hypothetical protein
MYASPHRFDAVRERSRRIGYGQLRARRPPRQVSRGRRAVRNLVIGAAVVGLLFGGFTTEALGAVRPAPQVIVVRPGETLWSIAETRYPSEDPRSAIDEIVQANHLPSTSVYPGEHLRLPSS